MSRNSFNKPIKVMMTKQIVFILLASSLSLWTWAAPFEGHRILISGPSALAADVALETYKSGGNVVDAAVAMGLALSVVAPYYGSLGGGGFAMVRRQNDKQSSDVQVLDFREVAPASTSQDFFINREADASQLGGAAVGVPGVPAGLFELHKRYGVLPWKSLFSGALRLAEKGFPVSGEWAMKTREFKAQFNPAGHKYFFKRTAKQPLQSENLRPGEILRQPQLARALKLLQSKGPQGFYSGAVAKDVVQAVQSTKGVMTLRDLSNYQVRWRTPMVSSYLGYKIFLMPPPSSGGVVLASTFAISEASGLANKPYLSVDEIHQLAEIFRRAYRGRMLLGDPDFVTNPIELLLNKKYLYGMAKTLTPRSRTELKPLTTADLQREASETTHFSIMDSKGNAVAFTVTLNGTYGSGVVSERFGIALNNEMDDFTTHPNKANMYSLVQGESNWVAGGKRPLSSMSPTLVEKDGQLQMALGAPGGPRIISSVFQVLHRVLANHLDADRAVQAPRVHHQFLPDKLYVDRQRWSPDVLQALKARGHEVEESWSGKVYLIRLHPEGWLEGSADDRGEGAVVGF